MHATKKTIFPDRVSVKSNFLSVISVIPPVVVATLALVLLDGCKSQTKKTPPYASSSEARKLPSLSEYESGFIDNPEMFPRELSIPARKEALQINWAMQKAVDNGALHVRLLAPPLQLTGDANIDRSATYEAVLVADDIPPGKTFLETYEVRVAPRPELYTVKPTVSAASLKDADLVLAEEELSLLRLDEATLKSSGEFASNMVATLSNRLESARSASTNRITMLQKEIDANTQTLVKLSIYSNVVKEISSEMTLLASIKSLNETNNSADSQSNILNDTLGVVRSATNIMDQAGGTASVNLVAVANTNGLEAQALATAAKSLNANNTTNKPLLSASNAEATINAVRKQAVSELLDLTRGVGNHADELQAILTSRNWADQITREIASKASGLAATNATNAILVSASSSMVTSLESRLEATREMGNLAQAQRLAIQSFAQFWQDWANSRVYFSDFATNRQATTNMTSVAIAFRPQAVAGLSRITIDVLRKQDQKGLGANSNGRERQDKNLSALNDERQLSTVNAIADSLASAARLASDLGGILIAPKDTLNSDSRRRRALMLRSQLMIHADLLKGYMIVLTNKIGVNSDQTPVTPNTATSGSTLYPENILKMAKNTVLNLTQLQESQMQLFTNVTELANQSEDINSKATNMMLALASFKLAATQQKTNFDAIASILGSVNSSATNVAQAISALHCAVTPVANAQTNACNVLSNLSDSLRRLQFNVGSAETKTPQNKELATHLAELSKAVNQASRQATNAASILDELKGAYAQQQQEFEKITNQLGAAAVDVPSLVVALHAVHAPASNAQMAASSAMADLSNALYKLKGSAANASAYRTQALAVLDASKPAQQQLTNLTKQLSALNDALMPMQNALADLATNFGINSKKLSPEDNSKPSPTPRPEDETLEHALENVITSLASLNSANFDLKNLENESKREALEDKKLTPLRGSLAKAGALVAGLRSKAGADPASQIPGVTSNILHGAEAVFQINVLHGVVSTTAFLMADDASAQLFGQEFADEFYVAQVTFRNPNDKLILIYGNTMRLVVRMNAREANGSFSEDGLPIRRIWWATYEPLDYDALRRMLEDQQEHSWRGSLSTVLDLALAAGGGYVGVGSPGEAFTRTFAVISALSPSLRNVLESALKRHAANFREKGLNGIEEIPAGGVITKCVYLPKGPIYGTYAFDGGTASELPLASEVNRKWNWVPFVRTSRSFGSRALQPAYIHDIRREEVFVEGKRILASDPLSSSNGK